MGNWSIHIEGVGPHHNGKEEDSDAVFVETFNSLVAKGHTLTHASFTYGGAQNESAAHTLHEHLKEKNG
jgi:hypothetical protein